MKQLINSYYENGILIKVFAYEKPRKSEKTFNANKFSVYNVGRKCVSLNNAGIRNRRLG